MADRLVTGVKRDRDGNVTTVCNHSADWSPRSKQDVIKDIESGTHTYYMPGIEGYRVDIKVVEFQNCKYLRSDPSVSLYNFLDDLPNCW